MRLLLVLITILFCGALVSAGENNSLEQVQWEKEIAKGGLTFILENVEVGLWNISQTASDPAAGTLPGANSAYPALAIRFKVHNDIQTQKVDLSKKFIFSLKDEFDNIYRSLDGPADYPHVLAEYPARYPSLYPGDAYTQTVFFEAPIEESRLLLFVVNGFALGIDEPIVFQIPAESIMGRSNVLAATRPPPPDDGTVKKVLDSALVASIPEDALKITMPQQNFTAKPGQTVHVQVEIREGVKLPDNIFVVSPGFVLEDPRVMLGYDFVVPSDYAQTMLTLIVIGKWLKNGEEFLSSDSITFTVTDPVKKCFKECIEQNKEIETCVGECRDVDKV